MKSINFEKREMFHVRLVSSMCVPFSLCKTEMDIKVPLQGAPTSTHVLYLCLCICYTIDHVSSRLMGLRFNVLIRRSKRLQMLEQRRHLLLDYFKTLSVSSAGNRTRASRTVAWHLTSLRAGSSNFLREKLKTCMETIAL